MEMVHLGVLTGAVHGRVADVGPGGITDTEGAPVLGHRAITCPLFPSLTQAAGHRAGAHSAPWPPATSHCWGGQEWGERPPQSPPSAPRPLRQAAPKRRAPWSHGLRSLSLEMAEHLCLNQEQSVRGLIPEYLGRVAGRCRPAAQRMTLGRDSQEAAWRAQVQSMCGFVSPQMPWVHRGRCLSRGPRGPKQPRPRVL